MVLVMAVPGLDPGIAPAIYVFGALSQKDVDPRDKPGDDGEGSC